MVTRTALCLAGLAIFVLISTALADIPRLITYQGRLTDEYGIPVPDNSYTVDFILYDDSTSGSQLWAETHAVETIDGLFNAQLGRHSSLDESLFIDHTHLFIAIQLSGHPEMSPRMRLTSSAFCYQAFHAVHADVAAAATIGGGWRDDGTIVRLDNGTDNVGIGTSTPSAKLEVIGKTTFGINQTNTGDGAAISGGVDNISEGIVSTIGGGQSNFAMGDGSTISGGAGNQATDNGATIGGGYFNYARGRSSVIGGGGNLGAPTDSNSAIGDYSVIGGGTRNLAIGYGAVISGGDYNTANKQLSAIGGGAENLADGLSSTIAGGDFNKTYGDLSAIGGGSYNRAHGEYSVVAGGGGTFPGDSNAALGLYSAILGGRHNTAAGVAAIIGGGENNSTNGNDAVVCGGMNNQALASSATVGGGDNNTADGSRATVAGGGHNQAAGSSSTIAGGSFNYAPGQNAFVGGGQGNFARGLYSVIGGGGGATNTADTNSAFGDLSVIGGGRANIAYDSGAVISGGCFNRAQGAYSVVAGGGGERIAFSNSAAGSWAVVGGGCSNNAGARAATVSGGYGNSATVAYATVAGGIDNDATEQFASIGGGMNNTASAEYSTVVGGENNEAAGYCSAVLGGQGNTASGNYSVAAGLWSKAIHSGTFVWADNTAGNFQSTHNNQFLIRASGGVGIGTVSPGAMLDVADDDRALRLRAGNGQAEFTDNQILLSYGGTVNYSHTIKSRHSSGNASMNAIEFYVWDPAVDASIEVGTKHVMTIDGEGVSGEVGIGTTDPNYTLDVRGTIGNNTTLYHSDERWKTNIETIPNALDKIDALRGVSFEWRRDEYAAMNFPSGKHMGLIAQEVEDVVPELVNTGEDGYKSVEYANLTALLIEAVKELKAENDVLKQRLTNLEKKCGE